MLRALIPEHALGTKRAFFRLYCGPNNLADPSQASDAKTDSKDEPA
jgi:hypothetical protein